LSFFDKENARQVLPGVKDVRIAVLGDLILDRYLFGDVERISPEAPVPIVKVLGQKLVPGGAGNVIWNILGLEAEGVPFGLVGDDPEGRSLLDLFRERDIPAGGVHVSRGRKTSHKVRVVSGRQQMIRLDSETDRAASPEESTLMIEPLVGQLARFPVVIISDYGKGVCSFDNCRRVIETSLDKGTTVVVDPKGPDWNRYRGASWITPNLKELAEAAGLSRIENDDLEVTVTGKRVRDIFGIPNLLVTRSEAGMTLISQDEVLHVRSEAREVFDVSGAGDTVVASLAVFLGSGLSREASVRLANAAAGIVVGKAGTQPVLASELVEAIAGNPQCPAMRKVISRNEAAGLVERWKNEGLRVVATNGCFDILHPGHVAYLERSAELGDRLIVAVNSDDSVRSLKGPGRPVNNQQARSAVLAGLSSVDAVCVFEEETPREIYRLIRPDVITKGGDYMPGEVAGGEFAGQVVIVPLLEGFSTSGIISALERDHSREPEREEGDQTEDRPGKDRTRSGYRPFMRR